VTNPAPYPADTRAKGWKFELDLERVRQSDTWALAAPDLRPWLLMLWATAWEQTPCGSLPDDEALIAARIGMSAKQWVKARALMLRGWQRTDDGRLYHATITGLVLEMLANKDRGKTRKAEYRMRMDAERVRLSAGVPHVSHGTDAGPTCPSPSFDATGTGTGTGLKKKERARASSPPVVSPETLTAAGFGPLVAAEFIAHKQTVRAPLTERAWDDHCREAAKAGWHPVKAAEKVMAKGWKGFEAKYVEGERRGAPVLNADVFAGAI